MSKVLQKYGFEYILNIAFNSQCDFLFSTYLLETSRIPAG
ncbi:hypothetical protein EAL2_c08270 [Peptoclostridium acidaminophilum DSM 3953]|uniref:Uncharacterized protein n=1 Tax=Peptoclostridium acidaminophilum DSM 3953 TaxID=1286171 RepID=W8TIX7_PEPAC|nr:hypothetical protein EAL2_c08270 [Peptoclostridium acidaminophilum DSM 3953]